MFQEAADCRLCLRSKASHDSEDLSSEVLNKSSQWTPQVPGVSRPHVPQSPQPPGMCAHEQPAKAKTVTDDMCNGSAPRAEGAREPKPEVDLSRRPETRDVETQTRDVAKCQTSDASTQCEAAASVDWHSDAIPRQGTRGQMNPRDTEALEGLQKGDGPWRQTSREAVGGVKRRTLKVEGAMDRETAHPGLHDAHGNKGFGFIYLTFLVA